MRLNRNIILEAVKTSSSEITAPALKTMAKCGRNTNDVSSDKTNGIITIERIPATTAITGSNADGTENHVSADVPNAAADDHHDDSYGEYNDAFADASAKVSSMEDMARRYIERRFIRGSSLFSSTSSIQDDDGDDNDAHGLNSSDKNTSSSSIKSTNSATTSSKRSVHDPVLPEIPHVAQPDGINIGRTLGKGSFAIVHEIMVLPEASSSLSTLSQTHPVASLPNNDQQSSCQQSDCGSISVYELDKDRDSDCDIATIQKDDNQESTEHTALEDSLSSSGRSYALKRIHPKVIRDDDDEEAVWGRSIDIACEAMMLSVLSHPNIVRMHGTSGQWGDQHSFGIVLDKLQWTLKEQIVRWSSQNQSKRSNHSIKTPRSLFNRVFFPKSDHRCDPSVETTLSRLEALYDVAKGMEYLHERSIIYRDLKLANIALNEETGKFCLIDFGLARELKPADRVVNSGDSTTDPLYRLTGMTGTPSYCAPEVLRCKWYGLSADVYSFAIVFWEVMALKRTPSASCYNIDELYRMVVKKQIRPPTLKFVSKPLRQLMEQCWADNASDRPSFHSICDILHDMLLESHVNALETK